MISGISSLSTLAVPTSTADLNTPEKNTVEAADKALNLVLQNGEMMKTLAAHSSKYVPPSKDAIMSLLWAVMNDDGAAYLNKGGVTRAIYAGGGGTVASDAIWEKIKFENNDTISAADFATNAYLNNAVSANIAQIREAVDLARIEAATADYSSSIMGFLHGGRTNVLSGFTAGTGTVLDLFS